jgi:hypothetical protein
VRCMLKTLMFVSSLLISSGWCAPLIELEDYILSANQPGQVIQLFVSGTNQVQGLNFNLQVADGGPDAGGSVVGPVITDVDVVTDTLFASNHLEPVDPGSLPQLAIRSVITQTGSVSATGLLATVTIDTTGITNGVYALQMAGTLNGDSDFAGIAADITNGQITIVSDPARIKQMVRLPSGFEISFNLQPGQNHTLQFRDHLLVDPDWVDLPGAPHDSGTVVDDAASDRRSYRLSTRPQGL